MILFDDPVTEDVYLECTITLGLGLTPLEGLISIVTLPLLTADLLFFCEFFRIDLVPDVIVSGF